VPNPEDEETLEELLAQLDRQDVEWRVQKEDVRGIPGLMREARDALPEGEVGEKATRYKNGLEEAMQGTETREVEKGSVRKDGATEEVAKAEEEAEETRHKSEKEGEEEEADEYIQQVLDQVEIERKYEPYEDDDSKDQDAAADDENTISLPSAPTKLPPPSDSTSDDALTSRFASLSLPHDSDPLGLPSAPSFAPSKKPVLVTKTLKSQAKSNLETYTDEDIDSWCCICNEDATVRCLGCDGDLYCASCWREGHGNRSGQERGHRALEYRRDRGEGKRESVGTAV